MNASEFMFGILAEWQESGLQMRLIDGIQRVEAEDLEQARKQYEAQHIKKLALNDWVKLVEIREI